MAANMDNDQLLRKAIKLMHSSHPNSATELRMMIDEILKQRYGPEKTLTATMGKRLLEEEQNFPGRAATPPPQPEPMQTDAEEIINLTNSPPKTISDSPDTIIDSDDGLSNAGGVGTTSGLSIISNSNDDDGNLKEFGDLNCCVCGDMMFTATNRLIECSKCGALYHQECHKPPIPDEEASEDQQHTWQCDNCLNKPSTSRAAAIAGNLAGASGSSGLVNASSSSGVIVVNDDPVPIVAKSKSSSRSSSSSNSSSPFYKHEPTSASSTSSKSNTKSSTSSSSKSSRDERSSVKASVITSTSDKASSSHSSSKKSSSHSSSSKSSSSKTSKHHESSSSKRKSNK